MYILDREFTLIIDYKPLTSILHPAKNIPAIAAARFDKIHYVFGRLAVQF